MDLEEGMFQLIVESSPNMIWRAGTDALCDYFNSTWLNFTGKTLEQEVGNGWTEGVHPDDYDTCLKIYLESFEKKIAFEMEYRLKNKAGVYRWINDRGTPLYLRDGSFGGYIGSCMDVTDKVEGQIMRDLAQHDGLTGIYTRQYFEQLANGEFARSKRFNFPLSIAMIDIDNFKSINDTYGHYAGDLVLKEIVSIINLTIREFDLFGRFGGDEFILLLVNNDAESAAVVADRIQQKIETALLSYHEFSLQTSVSIGICQLSDQDTLEKVIDCADMKLYEEKRNKSTLK